MGKELAKLEVRINHDFKNRALLFRALTHSSYANENPVGRGDNEQLEFLGDSIIGFVISECLLSRHPHLTEGQLSKRKAHLVSSSSLFRVASRLELGRFLNLGKGEEKTGGRLKRALLVDACEALAAAIYLDGGLEAARKFVLTQFAEDLHEIVAGRFASSDYKSRLQEKLQSLHRARAEYSVINEIGPDHRKRFSVRLTIAGEPTSEGQGETKKSAEQEAARLALAVVDQQKSLGESTSRDNRDSKES
jgi:ribonuclease III